MSTTDELSARLEWVDDWLVLVCGPWRFSVADIEVYGDNTATAYLRAWEAKERGASGLSPGSDPHQDISGNGSIEIACASRAEAVAVIRALLGVRGVVVPP